MHGDMLSCFLYKNIIEVNGFSQNVDLIAKYAYGFITTNYTVCDTTRFHSSYGLLYL